MKVVLLLALVGAAFAAPDGSNGVRPIVNYADSGSSVTILRGADLEASRGYESRPRVRYVQQEAPRVRVVQAAPRVQYVQAARPAVRYVQAAPEVRYVQAPAPRVRYVQTAPRVQLVTRPAPYGNDDGQALYVRAQPQVSLSTVRAPLPEIRVGTVSRPRYSESQESHDDARYRFAYEVRDDETYNYQAREETRDGHRVSGTYVVQDPDGFLRTVVYGDDGNGFYATVKREPIGSNGYRTVSFGDSQEK